MLKNNLQRLKLRSPLLADQCTPPKVSTRRDAVNFEWKREQWEMERPRILF